MRRDDPVVKKIIKDLLAALNPADPRSSTSLSIDDDERISELAVSLLDDPSVSLPITRRALLLLPMFPTTKFVASALKIMRNQPALAHVAAHGLRTLNDPSIIEELGFIAMDSNLRPDSRVAAASVLGSFGDPRCKPILVHVLKMGEIDPNIACAAAEGIGYIQLLEGSTDATEDVAALLSSPFPAVRLSALNALGNMFARQAVDRVEALLDDGGVTETGESVRLRAAEVSRLLRGPDRGK